MRFFDLLVGVCAIALIGVAALFVGFVATTAAVRDFGELLLP